MRLKTIKKRLQKDGVTKRTIQNVHSKMYGISDEDTFPGKSGYSKWVKIITKIKRKQKYFRGLLPKDYDFSAEDFISKS